MTQTLDAPTTRRRPRERAEAWLHDFEAALTARDVGAAAGMFAADLLLARPRLVHLEPHDRRGPGRGRRPARGDPRAAPTRRGFATDRAGRRGRRRDRRRGSPSRPPSDAGAACSGSTRRRAARPGRLLTTLYELKGYEEPRGTRPAEGRRARREQGAEHLEGAAAGGGRELGRRTQPYVLVIGGGQGGIALGARGCASSAYRRSSSTSTPVPATSGAAATSRCACTTRSGTTTCPTSSSRTTGRSSRPKDKIGDWLESYVKVMEIPYWSSTTATTARRTPRRRASGRSRSSATASRSRCGRSSWCSPPGCPASRTSRAPRAGRLPRRPAPLVGAPRPGRLRRQEGRRRSARTTRAFDICGALWENGADVTMVQRSSTHIVKSDTLMEIGLGELYSERGGGGRRDHREGGPDLRLAALPDPARVPDPGVRADGRARQGLLRPAGEGRLLATTGARTGPGCS